MRYIIILAFLVLLFVGCADYTNEINMCITKYSIEKDYFTSTRYCRSGIVFFHLVYKDNDGLLVKREWVIGPEEIRGLIALSNKCIIYSNLIDKYNEAVRNNE